MTDNVPSFLRATPGTKPKGPLLDPNLSGTSARGHLASSSSSPSASIIGRGVATPVKKLSVDERYAQMAMTTGKVRPQVSDDQRTPMTDTLDRLGIGLAEAAQRRKSRTSTGKLTIGHFRAQETKPNDPNDRSKAAQGAVLAYDVRGKIMALPWMFPLPIEAEACVLILNHALKQLRDPVARRGVMLQTDLDFFQNIDEISLEAWERIGEKRPEPSLESADAKYLLDAAGLTVDPNKVIKRQATPNQHLQILRDVIARVPLHPGA